MWDAGEKGASNDLARKLLFLCIHDDSGEFVQREGSVVRGLAMHSREAAAPEPAAWAENAHGPASTATGCWTALLRIRYSGRSCAQASPVWKRFSFARHTKAPQSHPASGHTTAETTSMRSSVAPVNLAGSGS